MLSGAHLDLLYSVRRYVDAWAYSVAEGFSQAKTATDCFAHICRLYRRDSVDIYY